MVTIIMVLKIINAVIRTSRSSSVELRAVGTCILRITYTTPSIVTCFEVSIQNLAWSEKRLSAIFMTREDETLIFSQYSSITC